MSAADAAKVARIAGVTPERAMQLASMTSAAELNPATSPTAKQARMARLAQCNSVADLARLDADDKSADKPLKCASCKAGLGDGPVYCSACSEADDDSPDTRDPNGRQCAGCGERVGERVYDKKCAVPAGEPIKPSGASAAEQSWARIEKTRRDTEARELKENPALGVPSRRAAQLSRRRTATSVEMEPSEMDARHGAVACPTCSAKAGVPCAWTNAEGFHSPSAVHYLRHQAAHAQFGTLNGGA
jgi:hypothetical protein